MLSINLHLFWAVLGIMGLIGLIGLMICRNTFNNELIDTTVGCWIIVTLIIINFFHMLFTDETAKLIISIQ